jgi:DENN (AEX-3) domain/uDENN domain/dDENN domain
MSSWGPSDRRLADYFVIVGLSTSDGMQLYDKCDEEKHFLDCSFRGAVLGRFPREDVSEDLPLVPGLQNFCAPSGMRFTQSPDMPKVHYFVASDAKHRHSYGVCLTFFEDVSSEQLKRLWSAHIMTSQTQQGLPTAAATCGKIRRSSSSEETSPHRNTLFGRSGKVQSHAPSNSSGGSNVSANAFAGKRRMGRSASQPNVYAHTPVPLRSSLTRTEHATSATENGRAFIQGIHLIEDASGDDHNDDDDDDDDDAVDAANGSVAVHKQQDSQSGTSDFATTPKRDTLLLHDEADAKVEADADDDHTISSAGHHSDGDASAIASVTDDDLKRAIEANKKSKRYQLRRSGSAVFGSRTSDKYYAPKCICILSQYPFLKSFRDVLTGLYQISLTPSDIPMERRVCNLMLEVPLPPPGRFSVQYSLGDEIISFKRCPRNNPLAFTQLPIRTMFEYLETSHIELLLRCVLMEHSILLYSRQLSLLVHVCETLRNLVYPFDWQHVYIPVLPSSLSEFCSAPIPYMIGTHTHNMDIIEPLLSEDVVRVDLDNNIVQCSNPPPQLPQPEHVKLMKTMDPLRTVFEARHSGFTTASLDDAFQTAPKPLEVDFKMSEDKVAFHESEVHAAFFRVFTSMLKNYRDYLIFPTAEEPDPIEVFDNVSFLKSVPDASRPFLEQLLQKNCWSQFIEHRTSPHADTSAHVAFFDESIIAKKNRSFWVKKKPTPFLSDDSYELKKTFVAPSPDTAELPTNKKYSYHSFPEEFDTSLIVTKPRYAPPFDVTLYRSNTVSTIPRGGSKPSMHQINGHDVTQPPMSPVSTLYSVWFSIFAATVNTAERAYRLDQGFDILALMRAKRIKVDPVIFFLLIECCGECAEPDRAVNVVTDMQSMGLRATANHYAALLQVFAANGQSTIGYQAMQELKAQTKNQRQQQSGLTSMMSLVGKNLGFKSGRSPHTSSTRRLLTVNSTNSPRHHSVFSARTSRSTSASPRRKRMSTPQLRGHTPTHHGSPHRFNYHGALPASSGSNRPPPPAGPPPPIIGLSAAAVTARPGSSSNSTASDDDNNDSPPVNTSSPVLPSAHLLRAQTMPVQNVASGIVTPVRPTSSERAAENKTPDGHPAIRVTPARVPVDGALTPVMNHYASADQCFEQVFPFLTIHTEDTCEECNRPMNDGEIRNGWTTDPNDYTTKCPMCGDRFVARFVVTPLTIDSPVQQEVSCEYISPYVLKKEIDAMIKQNTASYILSDEFRLKSPTCFWNLAWHFTLFSIPVGALLAPDDLDWEEYYDTDDEDAAYGDTMSAAGRSDAIVSLTSAADAKSSLDLPSSATLHAGMIAASDIDASTDADLDVDSLSMLATLSADDTLSSVSPSPPPELEHD